MFVTKITMEQQGKEGKGKKERGGNGKWKEAKGQGKWQRKSFQGKEGKGKRQGKEGKGKRQGKEATQRRNREATFVLCNIACSRLRESYYVGLCILHSIRIQQCINILQKQIKGK